MARKSRKEHSSERSTQSKSVVYNTAIYARLSKEDNGIDGLSIENQLEMLIAFLKNQPSLSLVDTFIDNGETGTNFERPAFSRMINMVKKGEINCIVVKDLSRFGRNYLKSGNYLERIFPYLGVRFISVSDGFDSADSNSNQDLLVSLKSILNDNYAKDISKKVATALDIKKKSGRFMGKIPPYGYIRSESDRHKLEIHEARAATVKRIFAMKLMGLGVTTIARKLNDESIPSQMKLRFSEGFSDGKEASLWHGSSVLGVLENRYYLGQTVERKVSCRLCEGGVKQVLSKEDWSIIPNTHDSIISDEDFFKVQSILENSRKINHPSEKKQSHRRRTENVFSGLFECDTCGSKLQRNSGYYKETGELIRHYFYCPVKYLKGGACSEKSVNEEIVKEVVINALRFQTELLVELEEIVSEYVNSQTRIDEMNKLEAKLRLLKATYAKAVNTRNELYEDFKEGLLSESGYLFAKDEYTERLNTTKTEITDTEKKLSDIKTIPIENLRWVRECLEFRGSQNLTAKLIRKLIKKIVVKDGVFQVHFDYKSELDNAIVLAQQIGTGGVTLE